MKSEALNIAKILDTRLSQLAREYPSIEIDNTRMKDYTSVLVNPENLHSVMESVAAWDSIPMNYLRCITGVDHLTHIEVVYILASVPMAAELAVIARCPRKGASLKSVTDIWLTAGFHERETYEFFGVRFENNPDLRRLLTSEEMIGFPLLKDYPKGGDPDDLKAMDAFLPDGWLEQMQAEKDRLAKWLEDEIAKRTSAKSDDSSTAKKPAKESGENK